jgi:hypothetical protein
MALAGWEPSLNDGMFKRAPVTPSLAGIIERNPDCAAKLDELMDNLFCLDVQCNPHHVKGGKLRPMTETMFATELMYFEKCLSKYGLEHPIAKAMICAALETDLHSTKELVISRLKKWGADVFVDWTTANLQPTDGETASALNALVVAVQGQAKAQAVYEAETFKRHQAAQKELSLVRKEMSELQGLCRDFLKAVSLTSPSKKRVYASDDGDYDVGGRLVAAGGSTSSSAKSSGAASAGGSTSSVAISAGTAAAGGAPLSTGAVSSDAGAPSAAGAPLVPPAIRSMNDVLRFTDRAMVHTSIQDMSSRLLHEVFSEFHEKRMHKGIPLRTDQSGAAHGCRVRLTVALLRAVATDAELTTLTQDAPHGLTELAMQLQSRFEDRLRDIEAKLKVTRKGKFYPAAIESRIQELERLQPGTKAKLQRRSSTSA